MEGVRFINTNGNIRPDGIYSPIHTTANEGGFRENREEVPQHDRSREIG